MIAPKLASALRRGGRIAVERPRVAAWALVTATCAMFVAGAALLAADSVERWASSSSTHASAGSLVVYLGEGVSDASAHMLAGELEKLPGVDRAELVPAADSAHRLERSLGADAALLDGVDLASLPSSVEVTLAPGVRDVLALSPTIRALRGTPGVADVVLGTDAPPSDSRTAMTAQDVAWGAAGVLGALAIIVVLASLRIRLQRERREREVYDLLGASPAFSIAPTALAGALHGAAAAVLAALALVLGVARYGDQLPIDIALPAASALFAFVALGAALGFVGGGLAAGARAR
ncbi:MAG TPA: permease-like cell division protein FtsX [Kofleriaceae bacterium]|nr:permease-like cell division protein FtsX [Kofleriaceae bacterium]